MKGMLIENDNLLHIINFLSQHTIWIEWKWNMGKSTVVPKACKLKVPWIISIFYAIYENLMRKEILVLYSTKYIVESSYTFSTKMLPSKTLRIIKRSTFIFIFILLIVILMIQVRNIYFLCMKYRIWLNFKDIC